MRAPRVALVGPSGSGKTALAGRLLARYGGLTPLALEDAKRDAEVLGAEDPYALLLDEGLDERKRRMTLRAKLTGPLELGVSLIDTPGAVSRLAELCAMLPLTDAAIVVLKADGPAGKAAELARPYIELLRLAQVEILGLALTHRGRREEAEELAKKLAADLRLEAVAVDLSKGYDASIEKLLRRARVRRRPEEPMRAVVLTLLESGVLICAIASGRQSTDDEVLVAPAYRIGRVEVIEIEGRPVKQAIAGDDVGILLAGVGRQYIKRGSLLGDVERPPRRLKELSCELTLDMGASERRALLCCVHAAQVQCKVEKASDGVLRLAPTSPLSAEPHDMIPELGTIILHDNERILGIGRLVA